jgi:hypothetical protein
MRAVIRHAVLMTLKPDIDPGVAATIVKELRQLPSQIPAIREYQVGPGLNEGNATLGIVGLFDDVQGYEEYRDHPAHRAVGRDHIVPAMESVTQVQFEV